MAITVHQRPANFSGVHNPLIYVLRSTNSAQPNFQYVIDIYITGVSGFLRFKRAQESETSGLVDIHRLLSSYNTYDFLQSGSGFYRAPNSFEEVQVKFGEEYGSTPVVFANLVTESLQYFTNSAVSYIDFITHSPGAYIMGDVLSKFLTNMPRTREVLPDTNGYLYIYKDSVYTSFFVELRRYNKSNGAAQAVVNIVAGNTYHANTSANKFIAIAALPDSLNAIPNGSLVGDTQPLIDDTVGYYTLQLSDNAAFPAEESELIRFDINYDCSNFQQYHVHFLNRLGGMDSFTFIGKSEIVQEAERFRYEKRPGLVGDAGGTPFHEFKRSDRGTVEGTILYNTVYNVTSGMVDEATAVWLKEMITSPEVLWEVTENNPTAININTDSFLIRQRANEKLMFVEFEFELSVSSNTQYR